MPDYADLLSIAANMQDKAVLLSGDSIAFLLTAMGEYLEDHDNWRGSGDFDVLTDEETDNVDAIIAKTERQLMKNALTGTVVMSPVPVDGALFCDGSEYSREDYPDLYAVYENTLYAIDENTFRVPNFVAKFPLGYTEIGLEGGEAQHELSIDEIPAHTHTEIIAVETVINGGLEAPAAAAVAAIGETGVTGLSQSHNNMPPFHTTGFYVWT